MARRATASLCDYITLSVQEHRPGLGSKFLVVVAGKTNGAHQEVVEKLRRFGQTAAATAERCDYVLLFCPVASRVGTDVYNALSKAPAGKPIVLVVMHHTFDPDYVVADSRRLVANNPNVQLTVDCLFYENHLLDCQRNDAAWFELQQHLSLSQGHLYSRPGLSLPDCSPLRCRVLCGVLVLLLVTDVILLILACNGSI